MTASPSMKANADATPRAGPPKPSPGPSACNPSEIERSGAAALTLLQLQADLRQARTFAEIGYFVANEARGALKAQQVIVFGGGIRKTLAVHTVSSVTTVDRSSPLVLWFDSIPEALRRDGQLGRVRDFEASAYAGQFDGVVKSYPLRHLLWVPWTSRSGEVASGMLLARSTPWLENDIKIAAYLAGAFAHAWYAVMHPGSAHAVTRLLTRRTAIIASAVVAGLLLVPVPMTALAPVEIGPRQTEIVTPGIDGIVRSVAVEPNAEVKAGQLLLALNDTNLRNRAEIAERDVLVADMKYKKAAQLAFVDARGRQDMAIARSELDLKLAERDYARELLQRTEIRAERDGVAFFADKKDLIGKPVSVGDKLMEIANPASSEFRIELPAADAIVLHDKARVKIFLDADPLNPIEATLVRASYKAAARDAQQFAFRLVAQASNPTEAQRYRLGMRGTAQIYSRRVPLGFYLFRRPIAAMRQWSGL